MYPDASDPESYSQQYEDIQNQRAFTRTRCPVTFGFLGISFQDCNPDGVPLPILLMSEEHHKENDVPYHGITTLQLGSRGGNRCWAQCSLREMNALETWINNDLQEAVYRFLDKGPEDRDKCTVFVDIIPSDRSRKEGPLFLPPTEGASPAQDLTPILSAIASLSVTVDGLTRPTKENPPGVSLPAETHNQLNEMQSVLAGLEEKITSLEGPTPNERKLRSDTRVADEIAKLSAKMDDLAAALTGTASNITKSQLLRKKEIIAGVSTAVKAQCNANMCFYSSLVGHHPPVSPQFTSGHGLMIDIDSKGNVLKGRPAGKAGKKPEKYSDLTDGVKTFVLSVANRIPEKWSMDIFADTDLNWREQDTARALHLCSLRQRTLSA